MQTISPRPGLVAACLTLFLCAACVTVNVYFPAAEVERAAQSIVSDVYANQPAEPAPAKTPGEPSSSLMGVLQLALTAIGPAEAQAADATSVSNATIRGLKQQIAQHHASLTPFYQSGAIGITNDGMLAQRDASALSVAQKAQLGRILAADNQARAQLYQEVARSLNVGAPQLGEVKAIFAKQWQSQAAPGWWIQAPDGSWSKK